MQYENSMAYKRVVTIFGAFSALQILSVKSGVRNACRISVKRQNLPNVYRLLDSLSLCGVVGHRSLEAYSGSSLPSEWGRPAKVKVGLESKVHVYISDSISDAEDVRQREENDDCVGAGLVFGYPLCCIEGFKFLNPPLDPVFEQYSSGINYPWQLNVSMFHLGLSLIPHVPCSATCKPSLEMAASCFSLLTESSREDAQELKDFLSRSAVIHTPDFGVYIFRYKYFENTTLHLTEHELAGRIVDQSNNIFQVGPMFIGKDHFTLNESTWTINSAKIYAFN